MISKYDLESFGYYDGYWREEIDEKVNLSVSQMVEEYQKMAGQEPDPSLYERLIVEEFAEWFHETQSCIDLQHENGIGPVHSPTDELKELADLVYVLFGYANALNWNLEEAVRRVHGNNLKRLFQDDGRIKRREDGKVMKNPNTPKVRLDDLV